MNSMQNHVGAPFIALVAIAGTLMTGIASYGAEIPEWSERNPVTAELTGGKEVPPVQTQAYGRSTIKVARDRSISGSVLVFDMKPTAAHIHHGPINRDGPVVLPLTKRSETMFVVPPNTKLTEVQYARFREGDLYINVHSERFPTGEIRAQMKP